MLYPKSKLPLDLQEFAAPSSEYRAAPFWAWNCALERQTLLREIDVMRRMGMGGFFMHPRVGMRTPYLSDAFFQLVEDCAGEAQRQGMLSYLYDEDKWPSGYAGGMVTKQVRYRQKYLCLSPDPAAGGMSIGADTNAAVFNGAKQADALFLGAYAVELDEAGFLTGYQRLPESAAPGDGVWFAHLCTCEPNEWYNNQTYVDTLCKEAIEEFAALTHERYRQRVGDRFGQGVPAIFTDEPQTFPRQRLPHPFHRGPVCIPFTTDFEDTFRDTYGYSLLDRLPELFWDFKGGAPSRARYHYHDHATERFASAFADTLGAWCDQNGLLLTGHMMEEPTLRSQTNMVGEAMRSYRGFGLPGIDLLCDARELSTAKQCQSAAHQYGREGMLSELYGVTGWDFPFCDHKLQGDWQAALGVTLRVPHLYWVSMEGEAKRDYPASIGHQSPWYEQYPMVEDHFARLNTALTRGTPHVRVGVIHPIESLWLRWGPQETNRAGCEGMEERFQSVINWLLYGLIDFDFLCESLLPQLYRNTQDGRLHVGEMAYDVVVVPSCTTLRGTTVDLLEQFAARGGRVIFAGEAPCMVDASPSGRPGALAQAAQRVPWEREALLDALDEVRELDIRTPQGERSDNLIYQMRDDGGRWLFVSHVRAPASPDDPPAERYILSIAGRWKVTLFDTLSGETASLPAAEEGDTTRVEWSCYCHDSLLLRLDAEESAASGCGRAQDAGACPAPSRAGGRKPPSHTKAIAAGEDALAVTLSEPNALLLDQAEWRLDGGAWQHKEDLLFIDNKVRDLLSLPRRCNSAAQPWLWPDLPENNTLTLRMSVTSALALEGVRLALEHPERVEICVNGRRVESRPDGWYVDEAIRTVPLPPIPAGETELLLTMPFGIQTAVEWCYLLGDFGVELGAHRAVLTAPVRSLRFGDIVGQGLPFYTGNVIYHAALEASGSPCVLRAPSFRAPVLGVALDGEPVGRIAFAPYRLALGAPARGDHRLDITLYGNRHNGFGPVHSLDTSIRGYGPGWWFTQGEARSSEYQLRPNGILLPPAVEW